MKILIISILFVMSLYSHTDKFNNNLSCITLIEQIQVLKQRKQLNLMTSIGTILFGKAYSSTKENKAIDRQLRLLKFKLLDCK